ncbi:MAG: hypothetical protein NZM12_05000, partial [Steroidobacteraceae bacterium]|nr:hypothetical protein [Steroidobacteraceae bacterium]
MWFHADYDWSVYKKATVDASSIREFEQFTGEITFTADKTHIERYRTAYGGNIKANNDLVINNAIFVMTVDPQKWSVNIDGNVRIEKVKILISDEYRDQIQKRDTPYIRITGHLGSVTVKYSDVFSNAPVLDIADWAERNRDKLLDAPNWDGRFANAKGSLALHSLAVQGVYDPADGSITLVANQFSSPEQAVAVFAHEIAHRSLAAYLGSDERVESLRRQVHEWASLPEDRVERKIFDAAYERAMRSGDLSGELLPYAIEEAVARGIEADPEARPGTVRRWLADLIDAIRALIRRVFGVDTPGLTAEKLVAIAKGVAFYDAERAQSDPIRSTDRTVQFSLSSGSRDIAQGVQSALGHNPLPVADQSAVHQIMSARSPRELREVVRRFIERGVDRLITGHIDSQWPFYRYLSSVTNRPIADRIFGQLKTYRNRARLTGQKLYDQFVMPINRLAVEVARQTGRSAADVLNDMGIYAQAVRILEANEILRRRSYAVYNELSAEYAVLSQKLAQIAAALQTAQAELDQHLVNILPKAALDEMRNNARRLGAAKVNLERVERALRAISQGRPASPSTAQKLADRAQRLHAEVAQLLGTYQQYEALARKHAKSRRSLPKSVVRVKELTTRMNEISQEASRINDKAQKAKQKADANPVYAAGMTDETANAIIGATEAAYGDKIDLIRRGANLYVQAYAGMLNKLVEARVLLPEEAARIRREHQKYVPLRIEPDADPLAFMDDEYDPVNGLGFGVKIIKRMTGRSEAEQNYKLVNPYAMLVERVNATARRMEAMPFNESLVDLALANTNGMRYRMTRIRGNSNADRGGISAIRRMQFSDNNRTWEEDVRISVSFDSQAVADAVTGRNIDDAIEYTFFARKFLKPLQNYRTFFITRLPPLFAIRNSFLGDTRERLLNIASRSFTSEIELPDGSTTSITLDGRPIAMRAFQYAINPRFIYQAGRIAAAWRNNKPIPQNIDREIFAAANELRELGGLSTFTQYIDDMRKHLYREVERLEGRGITKTTKERLVQFTD